MRVTTALFNLCDLKISGTSYLLLGFAFFRFQPLFLLRAAEDGVQGKSFFYLLPAWLFLSSFLLCPFFTFQSGVSLSFSPASLPFF